MPLPRVLPDTNVCYSISLLDLILRLDEADIHTVTWTEDLLAELERKWLEKKARSQSSATGICNSIRQVFPDGEIERAEYEGLIDSMPGKDPDDHVHAAAAVARSPITIITANLADFPAKPLAALGVTVLHPDAYLCQLFDDYGDDLGQVVTQMAADRNNPPMAVGEVVGSLGKAGATKLAGLLRTRSLG